MPANTRLLSVPPVVRDQARSAWGNLAGAARALAIAEAAAEHVGLSLVITRDTASADQLEQELRFFAPELPVLSLPDWETLPTTAFHHTRTSFPSA